MIRAIPVLRAWCPYLGINNRNAGITVEDVNTGLWNKCILEKKTGKGRITYIEGNTCNAST